MIFPEAESQRMRQVAPKVISAEIDDAVRNVRAHGTSETARASPHAASPSLSLI